jgi:Chaperone of endosialidase
MGKASESLYGLKPVTFKYNSDWNGVTQYGLIAEQVAELDPHLVAHGKDGEITTVHYEKVNAMLLNEFLKEHKKVEALQATVAQQQKGMQVLTAQLKEQAAQIEKVNAQLEVSKPAAKLVVNKP